jgi:vitamin B12 transporter
MATAQFAYPIRAPGASALGPLCRYATDRCQALKRGAFAGARGVVLGVVLAPWHRYARQAAWEWLMTGMKCGTPAVMALILLATGAPLAQAQTAAPTTPPPAANDYPPPEEAQAASDVAPIAVTTLATGAALPVDKLAQPVTVLTAEDLDRIGGADFTRVLAAIPGATWQRDGAAGAYTGVHLRGAGANDVLVLIDGVRMQDIAAIGGGFDFGTLTGVGIDRIDVLRGTDSVVWGSGAIGGVMAITTPETKGLNASFEVGSRDTLAENIAYGLRTDRYALSFNTGYTATDDIPGARDDAPGGFHQWRFGGRGRYTITDALSLVAVARYADDKASGNAFPLPYELTGDAAQALETEQFSGRAGAHYEKGALTLDGGYAFATTRTVYAADAASGEVAATWLGKSQRADLTGLVKLPQGFAVNFGADDEWTGYASSYDSEHRAREDSGHVLVGWYGAIATLTGGVRVDDHSVYGTHETYNLNASARLNDSLRLRASYAQGFKAPTLYQLYSGYGNAALSPELAQSYDGGIEYSGAQGTVRLALSLYRTDSRDLIDFIRCTGSTDPACAQRPGDTFRNVGRARAQGGEFEATYAPSFKWRMTVIYSHDNATDRTPGDPDQGKDLASRPRDVLSLSTDWTTPFKGLVLGADLRVQSASWGDVANTARLAPGENTTLRASLPFGSFLDFYARVENLFNDHEPTALGYGAPGRGVFVGVRVRY